MPYLIQEVVSISSQKDRERCHALPRRLSSYPAATKRERKRVPGGTQSLNA
jgi:hypothetical protein